METSEKINTPLNKNQAEQQETLLASKKQEITQGKKILQPSEL